MSNVPVDNTTNAAADAIEDAVRKSTFGIVAGSGAQKWTGIGTGTLVRWRGRNLILTADHVIGDTHQADLRFFFPNDTPPTTVDRETLLTLRGLPASGLRPFSELEVDTIVRDRGLDLAAIPLADAVASRYTGVAFELVDEPVVESEGQTSLVIGFPYDISRVLADDSRVVFTQIDWSPVEGPRSDLSNFVPSLHFLARYTPPLLAPHADPHGLSGAARWARRGPTPGVWHPNLDLIGVTVTYYPNHQLLKMVRRSSVNDFLRGLGTA